MPDIRGYVPILKARAGEFQAVRALEEKVRGAITPVFEVPPRDWDFKHQRFRKSVAAHLNSVAGGVSKAWTDPLPAFLDLTFFGDVPDGERAPTYMAARTPRHIGLVLHLDSDAKDIEATRIALADGRPLCVRATTEQCLSGRFGSRLRGTLAAVGARLDKAHFVVDAGAVGQDQVSETALVLRSACRRVRSVGTPAVLAVVACAFPENMVGRKPGLHRVRRVDWLAWCRLLASKRPVQLEAFGDYGIGYPGFKLLDPRKMKMSANIRYALADHWLIAKGRAIKDFGSGQYHDLAAAVVAQKGFGPERFSRGDEYISEVARNRDGPGNATTWRAAGTNRHLTLTVVQLANWAG